MADPFYNPISDTIFGTVSLLKQSHSFEDALRRAISYGGDSDTLGAIVGSLAEVCFGVDKALEEQALTYLSDEMRDVVARFKAKYSP